MTIHPPVYIQGKGYTARQDRSLIQDLYGSEGIIDATHLVASQVTGYQVQVTAGRCLVQGDTNANQGLYRFWSDAVEARTHTPDATNPRVDLLVARVYDAAEVGSGSDLGDIEIVQGTAASGANLTNLTGAPGQGGGPAIPDSACPLWYCLVPTSGGVTQFLDARPRAGRRRELGHTFAVAGEVRVPSGQTDVIPRMFVPVLATQSMFLKRVRYMIQAGTSATFKIQRNGSDVSGLTGIIAGTTAAETALSTPLLLANNDTLQIVVTAVSGTPQNMSATLVLEHTY